MSDLLQLGGFQQMGFEDRPHFRVRYAAIVAGRALGDWWFIVMNHQVLIAMESNLRITQQLAASFLDHPLGLDQFDLVLTAQPLEQL